MRRAVILLALLTAAVIWLATRRRAPQPPRWAELGDGVQPADPRVVDLAFPPHDPRLVHVDNAWTVACERCQLSMALADRLRD